MHYHKNVYSDFESFIQGNMGVTKATRPSYLGNNMIPNRIINPNRNHILDRKIYYDFELKSGQTIQTRNGDRYTVVYSEAGRRYYAIDKYGMHLGSIRYGLIQKQLGNKKSTYDVVKVYDCPPYFNCSLREENLVWSEETEQEPVEVTLEEIAKKFDIPVDKLRIED